MRYIYIMISLDKDFGDSQQVSETGLEGMYLVRGYKFIENAYSVITDLPLDEATRISREAFPRRDSEKYMDKRFRVDDWLRKEAEGVGVDIAKHNPVSFSVVRDLDAWKSEQPEGDGAIILPLSEVDLSNWSFTLDDSFVSAPEEVKEDTEDFGYPPHELHGRVLNGQELLGLIKRNEFPQEEINNNPRYFEAQLWSSAPTLIRSTQLNPESYLIKDDLTR